MHLSLGHMRKDAVRRLTNFQNYVCWLQLARGMSSRLLDLWTVSFLSSLGIIFRVIFVNFCCKKVLNIRKFFFFWGGGLCGNNCHLMITGCFGSIADCHFVHHGSLVDNYQFQSRGAP